MKDNILNKIIYRLRSKYSFLNFKSDLLSGFSVALLALPQSIAYALLLGLPAQAGIIAAISGSILTSSIGYSRYLVAGPTNATSLLLQVGTSQILYSHFSNVPDHLKSGVALQIISQIILFVGLMQILIGVLKLGKLTQFISRSVMMGYILGLAITIIITQSFHLFAIEKPQGVFSLIHQSSYLISHLHHLNPLTLLIGSIGLLTLVFLRKESKRIPRPLIMLILTALVASFLNQSISDKTPWSIPAISAPYFDLKGLFDFHLVFLDSAIIHDVLYIAFAIALLTIFELNSVVKLLSEKKGQATNTNRDIIGLGVSNIASSFFLGTLPSSGSATRSSFNYRNGAKSRLSGIFSGLFMIFILSAFHTWIQYIPKAGLAALLIVIAYEMIDFKLLKICLKTTKRDACVLAVTCLACLFLQLDIALFIGIALSLILYLRLAANTVVLEYAFTEEGHFRPIDTDHRRLDSRIRIINMEGNLFFGSIDSLQRELNLIINSNEVRSVILRFNNVHHLDASICHYLERLAINLSKKGKKLYLSEVLKPTAQIIYGSSVWRALGKSYLYEKDFNSPYSATKKAYDHALGELEEVKI
ncbi:MAG: Bicarbonate transporter BicA [Chlamydiae bacterium]|nr:Bicarbonate transporter BicA [Chlamydiota bacterium]